ncbi:hypothetical protein [Rhizobium sp. Root1220]|uniref:SMP-30/gluconolactonase/LRE family protein n=1 Tax=Rhizobium sp. Root1220 TaxID=1736432 RepID=UPI0006FD4EA2|nr:hypothetical protein [Rhizobium sp. Root1220]KQV82133.1 hypothetical protein ASC90_23780 [Rhizobium sp. Root1220]
MAILSDSTADGAFSGFDLCRTWAFGFSFVAALLLSAYSCSSADANLILPGAHLEAVSEGHAHTEGPSVDAQGNLFFTDYGNNVIIKWNAADGKLSNRLTPSGNAIGTDFDRAGNLIVAASDKGELWSIATNKKVTVLLSAYGGKVFNGPDDVWVRPDVDADRRRPGDGGGCVAGDNRQLVHMHRSGSYGARV